jgi:hypothetical protein
MALRPGDVLLVEGKQRFSTAIKYLTQSNWSHAALYIGHGEFIEADLKFGVIKVSVEKYGEFHTRICRPVGVDESKLKVMIEYIKKKQGLSYDVKNIIDLARFLFPTPMVPTSWKRKMLEFGSGDPTKVICSSVIAQAFQQIQYPILPKVSSKQGKLEFSMRHHSFYTPSDFDRSPYFKIIKPTLIDDFEYQKFSWE